MILIIAVRCPTDALQPAQPPSRCHEPTWTMAGSCTYLCAVLCTLRLSVNSKSALTPLAGPY